jgi:hypothetical protein
MGSEEDEPGWLMGTTSETVQHQMESFRQKQMSLEELMQPGWGDAADYVCERDMKYGTTEMKIPAVGQPHQTQLQPHHPRQHLEG